MKPLFLLILLGLTSAQTLLGNTSSDRPFTASLLTINRLREDNKNGELKAQTSLKIKMEAGLTKKLKLGVAGQTGATLNNGFSTLKNFDTDDPTILDFHVREFYAQYTSEHYQATLGAFGARKTNGSVTRPYPFAFIDGGRLAVQTLPGKTTVTLGSVGNPHRPAFYERSFDRDYIEIAFERPLWEGAHIEAVHEEMQDEDYYRAVLKQKIQGICTIILESIYDDTNSAFHSGLSTIFPFSSSSLTYTLIDTDHAYTKSWRQQHFIDKTLVAIKGTSSLVNWTKDLNQSKNLKLFLQVRQHHEDTDLNRYDAGIRWSLKM